jgi:hypothetical protein
MVLSDMYGGLGIKCRGLKRKLLRQSQENLNQIVHPCLLLEPDTYQMLVSCVYCFNAVVLLLNSYNTHLPGSYAMWDINPVVPVLNAVWELHKKGH